MNLSIWYRHFIRHESGEDTFIPDENDMNEIKRLYKPTPIGNDRRFDLETSLHWFGGPEERREQLAREFPMSEETIRAMKELDAHLRIRLVPSRP